MLGHTNSHILSEFGYIAEGGINILFRLIAYIPGVPVFFLISGFLIGMSYENHPHIKDYIKNRMLRIYPALYVNIFIGICILGCFGFVQFNTEFFSWLLAQMSIIQFYNAEMFRGFGVGVINGALWTISVELTFYIALPILFILFKKSRWVIGLLFFASFILWNYDLNSNKDIFYNKFLHVTIAPYLFLFLFGLGFYKFYESLKKYINNTFIIWLFIFTLLNTVIDYYMIQMNALLHILKWVVFSFLIFSFAFSYKNLSKNLLNGNDYTYGVYIYHMLVINIFIHLKLTGEIKYFAYVILVSGFLGVLSWHFIEKPFLKLKKHSLFNEMHK